MIPLVGIEIMSSQSQGRRVQRGFSLVEVLFGIFLAGLCATVLAATMPVANMSREKANNQNIALSLAQKQMESLRSIGYPNLTVERMHSLGVIDSQTPIATNTYSFTNVDSGAYDSPAMQLPSGQGRILLEQLNLDLRRVTIEMRWTENGRQRSISVGTLVANL